MSGNKAVHYDVHDVCILADGGLELIQNAVEVDINIAYIVLEAAVWCCGIDSQWLFPTRKLSNQATEAFSSTITQHLFTQY